MNLIDKMLIYYERETAIICSVLLIVINSASLYFITELLSCDEIMVCLTGEGVKHFDPYNLVYMLLVPAALNLLFVFATLLARLTKNY